MKNPKWNENEVANYNRLTQSDEVSMARIEGLAYTAVTEMYISRIEQEKIKQERNAIINALDQIADGICTLERILGVSLKDMAQRHFEQKLEKARKEKRGEVMQIVEIGNLRMVHGFGLPRVGIVIECTKEEATSCSAMLYKEVK